MLDVPPQPIGCRLERRLDRTALSLYLDPSESVSSDANVANTPYLHVTLDG